MDTVWNFLFGNDSRNAIAIAAVLVSTSLAISLYRKNRKTTALVYEFLAMTRLVRLQDEQSRRISLLVDGVPVRDVGLVQIRITNTGTEPIDAQDFQRPISFTVEPRARIFEAEVSNERPAGINAEVVVNDNEAIVKPTLFNSKDSIVIKLLIADFDGQLTIDSRIKGAVFAARPDLLETLWAKTLRYSVGVTSIALGMGLTNAKHLMNVLPEFPNDYRERIDGMPPSKYTVD